MPESIITVARDPTADTIAGSTSTDAGAPSKCRPPWFDTQMPSAPSATARSASCGCKMPLTTNGRFQRSRNRANSSQVWLPPERSCITSAVAFWLAFSA